jgi:hypothetical protein
MLLIMFHTKNKSKIIKIQRENLGCLECMRVLHIFSHRIENRINYPIF